MPDTPDPRLVFGKTTAGAAEVLERRRGLSPSTRRILILIDGKRSLAELPDLARAGELPAILAELQAAGLIALSGIVDELPSGWQARADPRLDELKDRLRGAVERELGPAGVVLEARIQDCVNLPVMRGVLREVIETVAARAGPDAAERIAGLARGLVELR